MYAVADIRGQNYYDLKGKSLNGDMKLVVQYKQYSDQPQGTILSQDPAPESMAVYGSEIKLIISAGPEEMAIPDLAGWKMEHAKAYLELMGFKVEVMMVQVSDYPKGYVQDTSPAVGEKRAEGDTVILRVSDVETTAPPPRRSPLPLPLSRTMAEAAGLTICSDDAAYEEAPRAGTNRIRFDPPGGSYF